MRPGPLLVLAGLAGLVWVWLVISVLPKGPGPGLPIPEAPLFARLAEAWSPTQFNGQEEMAHLAQPRASLGAGHLAGIAL